MNRVRESETIGHLERFRKFKPFPSNGPKNEEITIQNNTASVDDMENRRKEQFGRYLSLLKTGKMTKQWREYGRKHINEITEVRRNAWNGVGEAPVHKTYQKLYRVK